MVVVRHLQGNYRDTWVIRVLGWVWVTRVLMVINNLELERKILNYSSQTLKH